MAVNDTFVGITEFSCGPVAEFQSTNFDIFRLDLDSLKARIANLRLCKNGSSNDLEQSYLAMDKLRPAYVKYYVRTHKSY